MADALPQRLLDNVLPDRAALDEALTNREREVEALTRTRGVELALADSRC